MSEFDAPPPAQDGSTLTARAASGLRWSSLGYGALMVANIAYTVTISRLLDPAAFGLMALAQLVVLFVQFFARMGLASALVQKPELSEGRHPGGLQRRHRRRRGLPRRGVGAGPGVQCVFRAPDLPPVLRALGVSFVFEGWSMTGLGLLRRQLRFRELSIITVGTYVLGYLVVGVGLALLGAGVWSLVAASLVSTAAQAVWQYALLRHPVRPVLRWEPYQEVCGYGMRLSGAHLLDYVGSNLDTFTVGRFASTAVRRPVQPGLLPGLPAASNYLTQALTNVLFPHLSRIQQDWPRLRRAYLSVLALGASCVPGVRRHGGGRTRAGPGRARPAVGPGGTAGPVVRARGWLPACISELSQTAGGGPRRAEPVAGRPEVPTSWRWGAAGVRDGVPVARDLGVRRGRRRRELLRYVGYLGLARRSLGISSGQVWASYAPAAFASAGVALAIAATRRALIGQVPPLVRSPPRWPSGRSRWRCASASARCRPSAASCGCA